MELALIGLVALVGVGVGQLLSIGKHRSLKRAAAAIREELAQVKATPGRPPALALRSEHLLSQLATTWSLRSSEDQVLWSVFGTFWATNAILLVALFTDGKMPTPSIGSIISAVGSLMSLVWHGIQRRALGHIVRYEVLAERLEDRLGIEDALSTSPRRNKQDQALHVQGPISARTLMPLCSAVSLVAWLVALLLFLNAI